MEIRKAELKDKEEIYKIIQYAQAYLKEQEVPQWQNGYPNIEVITMDIVSGNNYVMVDEEKIVGSCMISFEEDKYYKVIEGQWLADKPYAVIHRIAIDPKCKGKGLATEFFNFAQLQAYKNGVNYIRVDTHEKNSSMRRCIEKNGFKQCGVVYVMDNAPRIAYEKEIENEIQ